LAVADGLYERAAALLDHMGEARQRVLITAAQAGCSAERGELTAARAEARHARRLARSLGAADHLVSAINGHLVAVDVAEALAAWRQSDDAAALDARLTAARAALDELVTQHATSDELRLAARLVGAMITAAA